MAPEASRYRAFSSIRILRQRAEMPISPRKPSRTMRTFSSGVHLRQAARYANAAAALATTGFGAVAPLPRPEAVWRMISQASSGEPTA